jgi:hypothetical protein
VTPFIYALINVGVGLGTALYLLPFIAITICLFLIILSIGTYRHHNKPQKVNKKTKSLGLYTLLWVL